MGKMVLGIVAVVLLQIAFFIYTAFYGSEDPRATMARTEPLPSTSRTYRATAIPDTVVSSPPHVAAPLAGAQRARIKRPGVSAKPFNEIKRRLSLRDVEKRERHPDFKPVVVHTRKTPLTNEDRVEIRKPDASRLLPRGHAMVFTDYPLTMSANRTPEMAKPKKGSYFARTLPALIKKPWNWMKSIASKLH